MTLREKYLLSIFGNWKLFELNRGKEQFSKVILTADEYLNGKVVNTATVFFSISTDNKTDKTDLGCILYRLMNTNSDSEEIFQIKTFLLNGGSSDNLVKVNNANSLMTHCFVGNDSVPLKIGVKTPLYAYVFVSNNDMADYFNNGIDDLITRKLHFVVFSITLKN